MKKRENMCWITVASIIMTIDEFMFESVMQKFLSQVILRMMIYECVDQGFTVHSLLRTVVHGTQWGRHKIRYELR